MDIECSSLQTLEVDIMKILNDDPSLQDVDIPYFVQSVDICTSFEPVFSPNMDATLKGLQNIINFFF